MHQLAPKVGVALICARYAGLALIAASYVGYVHIRDKTDQRLANAISNMAQLRQVFKQIDADGRSVAAWTDGLSKQFCSLWLLRHGLSVLVSLNSSAPERVLPA